MSDITDLKAEVLLLYKENAELREQTELLIALLRNDCNIEASWDGLRRFWNIGLTEDGCLMRDRACKAEAENDKLRELVRELSGFADYACDLLPSCNRCPMFGDGISCNLTKAFNRMRELGVEA